MQSKINRHQLSQVISYIQKSYTTYAVSKESKDFVLELIKTPNIPVPTQKTALSFKKLLWPDGQIISDKFNIIPAPYQVRGKLQLGIQRNNDLDPSSQATDWNDSLRDKKVAFIGLTSCDTAALNILLEELSGTDLLPRRENIFVLSAECTSDDSCFCTTLESKAIGYDLYVQSEKSDYSIFSGTKKGEAVLKENGIKDALMKPKIRPIKLADCEPIDKVKLREAIADFNLYQEFWQKIANNCFGCGSCSVVCPLCFCTRQEELNALDGSSRTCLKWDSCFAKSFSEIQNQHDLRPKRLNRLYNWYHHKFVRAAEKNNHLLCTGCGRCINACPAHLNQHKIITSILSHEEKIRHE